MARAADRNQGIQPVRTRVSPAAGVTTYRTAYRIPVRTFSAVSRARSLGAIDDDGCGDGP